MAITKVWGFEHLPQDFALGAQATGYGLTGAGMFVSLSYSSPVSSPMVPRVSGNKLIVGQMATNPGVGGGIIGLRMNSFFPQDITGAKKAIIGFRAEKLNSGGDVLTSLFGIESVLTGTGNPLFANISLADSSFPVGEINYYEIELNYVLSTYTVFKNDVQITSGSYTQAASNMSNLYWRIGRYATNWCVGTGPRDMIAISDIYTIVDMGDVNDLEVNRLGSGFQSVRLPLLTASGAGWTPSTGTIVDALSAVRTVANDLTPNVAASTDLTPLRLTVDLAVPGRTVKCVEGRFRYNQAALPTQVLTAKFANGGVNGSSVNLVNGGDVTIGPNKNLSNLELVVVPTS